MADQSKEQQIRIYAPKVIAKGTKALGVYANSYMGSSKDTVMVRVNDRERKPMRQVDEYDPTFIAEHVRWDMAGELIPGRGPGVASISDHLWKASIRRDLAVGTHVIEVKAKDMFGRTFTEKSSFENIAP